MNDASDLVARLRKNNGLGNMFDGPDFDSAGSLRAGVPDRKSAVSKKILVINERRTDDGLWHVIRDAPLVGACAVISRPRDCALCLPKYL